MDIQLDHLVHAVNRPEAVREAFRAEFGLHSVKGGSHPQWGTYNALAYFGLSYLEWIGVRDEATARTTAFSSYIANRLAIGEGVTQMALRTGQMDDFVRNWRARGLPFDGPFEASRQRPDGVVLRWRMLFPKQPENACLQDDLMNCEDANQMLLPFLIEWGTSDEIRLKDLEATGAIRCDSLYRLTGVHMTTGSVGDWNAHFSAYFHQRFQDVESPTHGEGGVLDLGDIRLYVWQGRDGLPSEGGNGSPRAFVPGPYQVDWLAHDESTTPRTVQLHGLTVRIVAPSFQETLQLRTD